MKKIFSVLALIALAGCESTAPETIRVEDNQPLVSYQQASSDIASVMGQTARWGGVIADIKNQSNGTVVEIVSFDLTSYSKPKQSDTSIGRFKAYIDTFLDPMVYQKGRAITLVGKIKGVEEGKVGEFDYSFPVLEADGYHLWKNVKEYDVTVHNMGYYPWRYPYWWDYPHSRRIVVKTKSHNTMSTQSAPKSSPQPTHVAPRPKATTNPGR